MNDRNNQQQLGAEVLDAFKYVQEIYRETKELITILDEMVGRQWDPPSSAAITAEFSRDLRKPHDWLVTDVYRIYHRMDRPGQRIGITIKYVDDSPIVEPILIGGRIDYASREATAAVQVPDRWVLRKAWFERSPENKEVDGTVYRVSFDEAPPWDCQAEATVFAVPLVSIQSKGDIRTKIYDRLMAV
jgi:hypothetical protein